MRVEELGSPVRMIGAEMNAAERSTEEPASLFRPAEMQRLRRRLKIDPQAVRQLRNDLLKKFVPDEKALRTFGLKDAVALHPLRLHRRLDSEIDGASKLLFKTNSGMLIESVILRIASGRTTVCVSSQIGCAAACQFCATGKMGIARNLTAAEILDQILQAGQILKIEERRLDNIVFMGMGEPFHNEANLHEAIGLLIATDHFDRSPARLLVSTVGIDHAMKRFAQAFPKVNLALSLHSADQAVRETIIPLAKKTDLATLHQAVADINRIQSRELMIEYLMLDTINDSRHDADILIEWVRGLRTHVNLIPYNTVADASHLRPSSPTTIERFANDLKAAGLKTTVRYSLGQDIEAACGQLIRKENRHQARAGLESNSASHNWTSKEHGNNK